MRTRGPRQNFHNISTPGTAWFKYLHFGKIVWRLPLYVPTMTPWMARKRFPHYWPFAMGDHRLLHKRSAMRSLGIFFVVGINKLLNKRLSNRWFGAWWCLDNVTVLRNFNGVIGSLKTDYAFWLHNIGENVQINIQSSRWFYINNMGLQYSVYMNEYWLLN